MKKALLALVLPGLLIGCASKYPNRNPVGETFPSVQATALDQKKWNLPADLAGKPALLLVGYKQDAQFDIDRWLNGVAQFETPVRVIELPTINSPVPKLYKGYIDEGMRGGIPEQDWGSVITVYGDAKSVVRMTGNEEGRLNARVLLLDAQGRVVWFQDHGYSARLMKELDAKIREMNTANP